METRRKPPVRFPPTRPLDERQSRVVELLFFGDLSVAETAAVLGISGETAMRDWKVARAWLMREMKSAKS